MRRGGNVNKSQSSDVDESPDDKFRDFPTCGSERLPELMFVRTNDPPPHVCRGFGFVTFVDQAGVDKVLAQTRHELDSKTVSSLSANPL